MTPCRTFRAATLLLGALLVAGCASLHSPRHKPVSVAMAPATDTPSARYIQSELAKRPRGQSGFRLLTLSTNALLSRITLADRAEQSIDLQYYIFKNDATGRLVAQHLLKAADRGVRVRMLLDDFSLEGQRDMLDALDAHANIEVRLFNPFNTREPSLPSKVVQLLLEGSRLNRRMHNKSFIIDNKVAVIGGRNIGDDYFDASLESNFRDLDLVAIGPVVAEASRSFDLYWNGEAAVPVKAFAGAGDGKDHLAPLRVALARDARAFLESDYTQAAFEELPDGATADRRGAWFWGEAILVADSPEKIEGGELHHRLLIAPTVRATLMDAQADVKLISPYFIPSDDNIADIEALTGRGVRVSVLTNSLASTDEAAVYAHYAASQRRLLQAGVDLRELRPAHVGVRAGGDTGESSGEALHAKAVVVDGDVTFVGSMNLDPRSELLNTEMGLIVQSTGLAKAVSDFFDSAAQPASAYRLQLHKDKVTWLSTDAGGKLVRHKRAPDTRGGQRLKVKLMRLLPIKGLL